MKKTVILIGDNIITNKNAECGADKKGIITCNHPDNETIYGVKFDFIHKSFHKLQSDKKSAGILNDNKGLWLEPKDFKINSIYSDDKRLFNNILMKNYLQTVELIPKEVERAKSVINSCKKSIADRLSYNKLSQNEIERYQKDIVKLEKQGIPEPEDYYALYEKLKKNKNIKEITTIDKYLIVKTNDLTYHHNDNKILDFDLGAFYIYIPENLADEIRIINYKRQMNKGYHNHPCVREGGYVCMGDSVRAAVNQHRKDNQFQFLIYLLINFLKEPNYGAPYINAERFRCAQPVAYKPKNIIDYLNYSNSSHNDKWDETLFNETMITEYKKDIARFKKEKINLDYIENLKIYINDFERMLRTATQTQESSEEDSEEEDSEEEDN